MNKVTTMLVSVFAGFVLSANAGMIIGGSTLLTSSSLDLLETRLGQGDIDVTNIFTKQAGSNSQNFHTAVDGRGATFSIMEITNGTKTAIVGGYNPLSWSSTTGFTYSLTNDERTAFLFNLTTGTFFNQKLTANGKYQTFGSTNYGPTFGGGYDLNVGANLSTGYSYGYSYTTTTNITGFNYNTFTTFKINALEVFTIAPASVPEPSSIALMISGLLSFAGVSFIRRKK